MQCVNGRIGYIRQPKPPAFPIALFIPLCATCCSALNNQDFHAKANSKAPAAH